MQEHDMSQFKIHTPDTTSDAGRDVLQTVSMAYGFVPNLMATMVEAPATAKGYLALSEIFASTSFSPVEQQVVLLTTSRANGCEYCVAAHSTIAGMQKVDADIVAAIRDNRPIADAKLEALRVLINKLNEQRGWLSDADVAEFIAAGYGQQQVLEAVLGVAFKTISNYTNHIAGTPVDEAFAKQAWKAPQKAVA
jgi:uncharacterized peroxidase-related enzyme